MSGYDEIAEWYDEAIREGALAPFHAWIVPISIDAELEERYCR